jgi:hypothetical protein
MQSRCRSLLRQEGGRTQQAVGMMDEALAHIERTGEKIEQAEMLRPKGEMLMMSNRVAAQAESSFRAAIEVALAQEARWWELRATTTLAKLRDTGRRDDARAILAEIYDWFKEGFDTADMKDVKGLLDKVGA